jgi:GTP-binding protein EngB required for normal cell division
LRKRITILFEVTADVLFEVPTRISSMMNPHYYHGIPASTSNNRAPQYPSKIAHGYEEEDHPEAPPSYTATLESLPLGTDEENRRLLDQVDRLRECGVEKYIDLPQIVVVGDQSTGKSSVLNALTDIPFPRDSVKCTRFATQIRLRRSDKVETSIRIIPYGAQPDEEKQALAAFKETFYDQANFEAIFESAKHTIFPKESNGSFVSKSILSIEVSGPTQPHLTLVDLPGIIHSATMEQTEKDKEDIIALARYYMRKERTIILPVVSGGNDISNQAVLGMVKQLDPEGKRTLGVITKPDKTETQAREMEFINLASNKDKKNRLQLGWHVLRNRTPEEMHYTLAERNKAEIQFFATSAWGQKLYSSQLGVGELSKRLSTQLIRHIAAEVFKVRADIERELEKCREKLAQLGDGKDTPEEMREELFRWCDRSLRLTQAAVQGRGINPSGEDFFPTYESGKTYDRNFRSRVVKQNIIFASHMENWGSACLISLDEGHSNVKSPVRTGTGGATFPEMRRSEYISKVVCPLIQDNPGLELSMDVNNHLVYSLFQSYSANWPKHAADHIKDIHKLCEDFLLQVLQEVFPKQIQTRIWTRFIQSEIDCMLRNAQKELGMLMADRKKLVTPYESEFQNKYYEWKEFDVTKQSPVEMSDQRYEDVLRKMILLYQVCDIPSYHIR